MNKCIVYLLKYIEVDKRKHITVRLSMGTVILYQYLQYCDCCDREVVLVIIMIYIVKVRNDYILNKL